MKARRLSPYTLHAIAITGGRAEYRDRCAPTWDGKMWHLARLHNEGHVLHEVAHWMVATDAMRAQPNYGLGRDPDNGPVTKWDDGFMRNMLKVPIVRELVRGGEPCARALESFVRAETDPWEERATVLSLHLMRLAGLPYRRERCFRGFEKNPTNLWQSIQWLADAGIDVLDPLRPFQRAHDERAQVEVAS